MIKDQDLVKYARDEVRDHGYLGRPCASCSRKIRIEAPVYFMGRMGARSSLYICEKCWISVAGENFLIETPEEASRYHYPPKHTIPFTSNSSPAVSKHITKDGRVYPEDIWRAEYLGKFVKPDQLDYGREVLDRVQYEEIFGVKKKI